uniref:Reverse transcriptase domain-containing protein n=1 Tax=Monopterus albus TaxID=43700 RepID=A0A3Q3R0V1_MONAL
MAVTDHFLIHFEVLAVTSASRSLAPCQQRRIITPSMASNFAMAFSANELCSSGAANIPACPDAFLGLFDSTCLTIMESIAPLVKRRSRNSVDPWLNDTTRALRRRCRQAEQKWKKDGLHVSLTMLRDSLLSYQKAVKDSKSQYLSNTILNNSHHPKVLFNTINAVINPQATLATEGSVVNCNLFQRYFIDKVLNIRRNISMSLPHVPPVSQVCHIFDSFTLISLHQLKKLVAHLKPTSSPLDIVLARIIKEAIDTVGPTLVNLINGSLRSGLVPTALKHAIVRPLLKKVNLDPADPANFHPISLLPFLAKVMEKVVLTQLQSHLEGLDIADKFQSGFKARHSTESALLRVHNDIAMALDAKHPIILALLDLSAAFDTVDHAVLLSTLEHLVGLRGTVLNWFSSFLRDRTFSVIIDEFSSDTVQLTSGIPQGSTLEPLLFSLYLTIGVNYIQA